MYAGMCLCSVTRGQAIYGEGFCIKIQWCYQIGSEHACKQASISNTSIGSKQIRQWKQKEWKKRNRKGDRGVREWKRCRVNNPLKKKKHEERGQADGKINHGKVIQCDLDLCRRLRALLCPCVCNVCEWNMFLSACAYSTHAGTKHHSQCTRVRGCCEDITGVGVKEGYSWGFLTVLPLSL